MATLIFNSLEIKHFKIMKWQGALKRNAMVRLVIVKVVM